MTIKIVPLLFTTLIVSLSGCSYLSSNDNDYQNSKQKRPLEAPPALVIPGADPAYSVKKEPVDAPPTSDRKKSATQNQQPVKTTSPRGLSAIADGDSGYFSSNNRQGIRLHVSQDRLWPELLNFWYEHNYDLNKKDKALGIIQTNWSKIGKSNKESSLLNKLGRYLIGSKRQRFQSIVNESDGDTIIYLSHERQEKAPDNEKSNGVEDNWQDLGQDNEKVKTMLNQMYQYLLSVKPVTETAGEAQVQTSSVQSSSELGDYTYATSLPVNKVWGSLLRYWENQGVKVVLRDREAGILQTDWMAQGKKKGFLSVLSKYLGDERVRYKMVVIDSGQGSDVYLTAENQSKENTSGNRHESTLYWAPARSDDALTKKILSDIQHAK